MAETPSNDSPNLYDAASQFAATEIVAERINRDKVTLDYSKLRDRLELMRKQNGWRPATSHDILLSVDPNSEGQLRFQSMLKHSGFDITPIPFRNAFVSFPPGRSPRDTHVSAMNGRNNDESRPKPIVTFAPLISYIAGRLASYPEPNFLVVTHAFEIFEPLRFLRRRFANVPNARIGVAYFGSLLDYRWKLAGLLDKDKCTDDKPGIEFFDLDPYSSDLLGVDLSIRPNADREANSGLDKY